MWFLFSYFQAASQNLILFFLQWDEKCKLYDNPLLKNLLLIELSRQNLD